jgi:hypothetical protein
MQHRPAHRFSFLAKLRWVRCSWRPHTFGTPPARVSSCEECAVIKSLAFRLSNLDFQRLSAFFSLITSRVGNEAVLLTNWLVLRQSSLWWLKRRIGRQSIGTGTSIWSAPGVIMSARSRAAPPLASTTRTHLPQTHWQAVLPAHGQPRPLHPWFHYACPHCRRCQPLCPPIGGMGRILP